MNYKVQPHPPFFRTYDMIYISAPYNHKDPNVIEYRMLVVYSKFAELMMQGEVPISPLMAHSVVKLHPVPSNAEFWEQYSITLLSKCSKMIVLQLDGWNESTGVAYEIKYAKENNIEIIFA